MNKFKLTKEVINEIGKIARKLPQGKLLAGESPLRIERKVLGSVLLEKNPKAKDSNDKPLMPNKYYRVGSNEFKGINHIRRLKKAYKQFGQQGIDDYIKKVRSK